MNIEIHKGAFLKYLHGIFSLYQIKCIHYQIKCIHYRPRATRNYVKYMLMTPFQNLNRYFLNSCKVDKYLGSGSEV